MSDLRVIRYFTSTLSQNHPAGWYFADADNVNNIAPDTILIASTNLDMAPSPSLEGANRIYLDEFTPAGNISGGGGDDEFYVTPDIADGIIIADSEGENIVIFAGPTTTTDNAGVETTKSIAIKSTNTRSIFDIPIIDLVIETTTVIGNAAPTTSEATLTVKGIRETSGYGQTGITRFGFETGELANLKLTATDLENYLGGDFTFPKARYVVEKDENTTGRVLIVTAVEKDRDLGPVRYFITDASNPDVVGGGKLFSINEATGYISLNQALNYEQDTQNYTLTVVATEGANSAMTEVQVNIGNVDEGKAGFIITSTRQLPGGVGESITSNDHFDAPQIGDELRVVVVTPDPDGIAEIVYDWFRSTPVGSIPLENFRTTEPSYTLTEDDLRFRMNVNISYVDNSGHRVSLSEVTVNPPLVVWLENTDGTRLDNFFTEGGQLDVDNALAAQDYVLALFSLDATGSFTLPNDNTVFRIKYLDAAGEMVRYEIGTDATAHNPNAPAYWDDFLPLVSLGPVGNAGKIYFSANRLPTFAGDGILSSVAQTFTIEIERGQAEASIIDSEDFTITLIGKDDPITALTAINSPSVPRFDDELLADPTRAVVSGEMVITDLDDNDAYRVRTEYTFTDIDSQVMPGAAVPIINDGETGMIDTPLGMLALNLDGKILTWTYTYDLAQLDVLVNPNDRLREDFRLVVEDFDIATGNSRPLSFLREDLIIKLFKRDNPPEFEGELEGAVLDDIDATLPITATGTITGITDPDGTDIPAGTAFLFDGVDNVVNGTYGTLRFTPTQAGAQAGVGGSWIYTLDHALAATRALTGGEVVEEQFFLAYQVTPDAPGETAPLYKMPLTITITGADDPFQFTEADGYSFRVNENSDLPVGVARALDADAATQPRIGYAIIEGDPNQVFYINGDGLITLRRTLDYETDPQTYNLTILASDGTNSANGYVQVDVQDVDESPQFAQSDYTADVKENTLADGSYVVATITANDVDAKDSGNLRHTITGGNVEIGAGSPNAGEALFVMDADSGVITLHGDLDFEAITRYSLDIEVEDTGGNKDTAVLTVNVVDVDEYAFVGDLTGTVTDGIDVILPITVSGTITELLDPRRLDVPPGVVSVKDAVGDSVAGAYGTFTYTTAPTGTGGIWEYVLDHARPATRALDPNAPETITETFTLVYTLTADARITYETDVVITIIPYDYPLSFIQRGGYDFAVDENTTAVGMVLADDPEVLNPPAVSYSISAGNDDGYFHVDDDGVITLISGLDYESDERSYDLTVKATSGGDSDTTNVRVTINDVREAPVFTQDEYMTDVPENATDDGRYILTSVSASDEDAGSSVRYEIKTGASDIFAVNPQSGAVSLIGALDHEITSRYVLEIEAIDNEGLTDTANLIIDVTGVNEFAPIFPSDAVAWRDDFLDGNVLENTALDAELAQITATDADGDATLTYAFVTDLIGTLSLTHGAFTIDADSGVITLTGALDYESTTLYNLDVQASDGRRQTPLQSLVIRVGNAQEGAAKIDITGDLENLVAGEELQTAIISADPDGLKAGSAVNYRWFHKSDPATTIGTDATYTIRIEDEHEFIGVERIYTDNLDMISSAFAVLNDAAGVDMVRVPAGKEDKDNNLTAPSSNPTRIEGGNGADTIQDGSGDDIIDGGLGDDTIDLGADATGSDRDQVMYRIGNGVTYGGGDGITGFERGQDTLVFALDREEMGDSIADKEDLLNFITNGTSDDVSDDQFLVMLNFDFSSPTASLTGVSLHFHDSVFFSGGRISMPILQISFAAPLGAEEIIAAFGTSGQDVAENVYRNGMLSSLDHLEDLLGGEGAISFEMI